MATSLICIPLALAAMLTQVPAPTRPPGGKPVAKSAAPAAPPSTQAAAAPVRSPSGTPANPLPTVQYDPASGWPIVPGGTRGPVAVLPAAAPAGETAPARKESERGELNPAAAVRPLRPTAQEPRGELTSGMQLGSGLLDIFQATRSPGAFKELGGVVVWWQLHTFGARGEELGMREVRQTADCAFAERDRLDYADGRTFGRISAQVYAERQGMPAPTLTEAATQELLLFGSQLRMPWLFADARAFAVVARDVEERDGERLARLVVERRPPPALDLLGPELDPAPRDRYEICYEPSTGLPREFVHCFAASKKQRRRVVLEDWRDFEGVRVPYRRAYVDESMRVTTSMEIVRIERQRVTDRDFRLH